MAYIGNGPGVASQRIVSTLTATDGQTSFTPTSGYTVGYVDVYLNGVKLISGTDFTASNGTNVVLTSGAATGDTLEVVAYLPRGLSDGYTKAEADARYMDINAVTLPDQTGHSGQFLQSDGTTADWATVDLTQFAAPVQLKNYTTTERNALTGIESGDTIYNSTIGSIEFYNGSNWIATNLIPSINSVTGTIYSGYQNSLTLNLVNSTDVIDVKFFESGTVLATVSAVNVSNSSATVTVPSEVYGQSSGDSIQIQIFNQDGTPSSNTITKTVSSVPTGGTVSQSGNYRVHTFTSSSSLTVPSGLSLSDVEYVVVAGGGGGGGSNGASYYGGGGGGAGGYRSSVQGESSGRNSSVEARLSLPAGSYTVTIGAGGADRLNKGSNSVFHTITSLGGGYGGEQQGGVAPTSGGSGGGAGRDGGNGGSEATGASGTTGQGFQGGNSNDTGCQGAGGGGGAGQAGFTGTDDCRNYDPSWTYCQGGAGIASSIRGTSEYRAGGGGGDWWGSGATTNDRPQGGAGGGGHGANANRNIPATNGASNSGGGGGGGDGRTSNSYNGAGGSGVVIVRYQL
jgi:hypothetical protein